MLPIIAYTPDVILRARISGIVWTTLGIVALVFFPRIFRWLCAYLTRPNPFFSKPSASQTTVRRSPIQEHFQRLGEVSRKAFVFVWLAAVVAATIIFGIRTFLLMNYPK